MANDNYTPSLQARLAELESMVARLEKRFSAFKLYVALHYQKKKVSKREVRRRTAVCRRYAGSSPIGPPT